MERGNVSATHEAHENREQGALETRQEHPVQSEQNVWIEMRFMG